MPLAEIRGIQICFERGGQGPPVLLISGTGGDLRHKPSVFRVPFPNISSCWPMTSEDWAEAESPMVPTPWRTMRTMRRHCSIT